MNEPTLISPAWLVAHALVDLDLAHWPDAVAPPPGAYPVWVGALPYYAGASDNAMAVFDTTGRLDGRYMSTGEVVKHPGIQLRVRHRAYTTGRAVIAALYVALTQNMRRRQVMVDATPYFIHNVTPTSDIITLGRAEDTRLFDFTANFVATVSAEL